MPDQSLHAVLRRSHEELLLQVLHTRGPQTRAQLAQATGIPRTTLSDFAAALLSRGEIVVAEGGAAGPTRQRGRPAERLALNPAAGQLLGVDFGHQRVHAVIVNKAHEIVASADHPYDPDSGWAERVPVAFELIEQLADCDGVDLSALQGVGIGFPGPFSPGMPDPAAAENSEVTASASKYVVDAFTGRFHAGVILDNNTRFAGLAEAIWGGTADVHNILYARLSHGVGGGLVVDGRLVTGAAGFAGELGHVSVRPDGRTCRCGKRGCLETIASLPAILAACGEQGVRLDGLEELASAAERGDPVVDRVLRTAGEAVGHVLGTVAMALDPEEIVLAGDIVHRAPALLAQAETTIRWELLPIPEKTPAIRAASLGDEDGALGAVAALFHQSPLLDNYPDTVRTPALAANSGQTDDSGEESTAS